MIRPRPDTWYIWSTVNFWSHFSILKLLSKLLSFISINDFLSSPVGKSANGVVFTLETFSWIPQVKNQEKSFSYLEKTFSGFRSSKIGECFLAFEPSSTNSFKLEFDWALISSTIDTKKRYRIFFFICDKQRNTQTFFHMVLLTVERTLLNYW